MSNETYEQQMRDSDIVFTAVSNGNFDNFAQAQSAVCLLYVPDMSISRAGISHALKRLEAFYKDKSKPCDSATNEGTSQVNRKP